MTELDRRTFLAGSAALPLAACATTSPARELTVMSSGGFFAVYDALHPAWSKRRGVGITTLRGASSGGAPDSIPERLARGEAADVVILSDNGFQSLAERSLVLSESRVPLVQSRIGMAVRDGAPVPDISTPRAFERVLHEAGSIGYSASASGRYLSTDLWPRMGVWDAIQSKALRIESERVASVVARGEVEIGFQQISEILPIPGATFAGPIPDSLQKVTTFVAGIARRAKNPRNAMELTTYLASPDHDTLIRKLGLEPVAD